MQLTPVSREVHHRSRRGTGVGSVLGLADGGINGEIADKGVTGQSDPFHEEIIIREAAELPYGGEWKGKEGLRALMTKINSLVTLRPVDVEVFDLGENHVITRQVAKMTRGGVDRELEVPMVEIYHLEDGKIREIDVFYKDTKAMVDFMMQRS
ncbi:nuclear transport factor 2 family protein [Rhodococcus sp. CX]|uniref:nuclear transport factor 2 family protein n=1 Tax=Rhodococcus sp. CX TaxID=2789880 RepID=UPI0018CF4096|nr:nuclear transport factor 2 family protein [Rhodococcus sp. CX]MBH0118365.1 nuclear transport factor 2 family protein [Rhodococcus sp. CX]